MSSSGAVPAVGVIGLGAIGAGVAGALVRSPFRLVVCDVRAQATERFAESAKVAADARELGAACDVVLVAVVDDDQVRQVLLPPDGALGTMTRGGTVLVLSTVSVPTVLAVAEEAAKSRVTVVDCGVTGGPAAAADGELVSMVGGTVTAIDRVRPVLDVFSSLVVHMGELGTGLQAKLARNLVQYGAWLAAYEGQRLAEAAGIELSKLAQVIRASEKRTGGTTTLMFRDTVAPFPSATEAGLVDAMRTAAGLAHKDLQAAMALAESLDISLPLARLADASADDIFGVGSPPDVAGGRGRVTGAGDVAEPSEQRRRGREMMQAVYGFDVDPDQMPGRFVAQTVDHLFGEVWTGEELGIAERRLLTIGVLAAVGQPKLLEIQFQSALRNDELTAAQIRECVVHLAHYVGWPLATGVSEAAEKAIKAAG